MIMNAPDPVLEPCPAATESADQEVQRLMRIAEAHARTALAKPRVQRDSFLAHCRNNWLRYAEGHSRSAAECARFAAAMDRATRDLMEWAESGGARQAPNALPAPPPSVEGGIESVLVYEAVEAMEASARAEAAEATRAARAAAEAAAQDLGAQADAGGSPSGDAETADRAGARYGFDRRVLRDTTPPEPTPKSEDAAELQRKIQAVLRARQSERSEDA
jgi:hypothetical protein